MLRFICIFCSKNYAQVLGTFEPPTYSLLGHDAALTGNLLPTFQRSLQ